MSRTVRIVLLVGGSCAMISGVAAAVANGGFDSLELATRFPSERGVIPIGFGIIVLAALALLGLVNTSRGGSRLTPTKTCPECGQDILDCSRLCPYCGAGVEQGAMTVGRDQTRDGGRGLLP